MDVPAEGRSPKQSPDSPAMPCAEVTDAEQASATSLIKGGQGRRGVRVSEIIQLAQPAFGGQGNLIARRVACAADGLVQLGFWVIRVSFWGERPNNPPLCYLKVSSL
jgi:hypothetical protein